MERFIKFVYLFVAIIFFCFSAFFATAQAAGDLALNKPIVSVSSTSSGSSPANCVDGNPATFWTSGSGGAQWLGIDLGQTTSIGTVVVKWGTNTATNYNIELSDDGIGYTVARSGINGDFNSSILGSGRYILIRTITGSNSSNYQLASLEVYVAPPPTLTPTPTITPIPTATPTPIQSGPTPTPTKTTTQTSTTSATTTTTATPSATIAPTVIPSPAPTPVPCTLTSASWSTTTTTQGSTVNLNVVGNTNCAGKQVSFEVRRNGTLVDDISANIQPQSASMSATLQVSATWVSERNPLIPFTDAQYYFKATPQGGVTINTKPQLLTVTSGASQTGPQIASITDNKSAYSNSQVPKFEKLEITFQVNNTVAKNLQMPFDPSPPPGIATASGITVNAEFSQDNFQTVYTQPAFYYQDFDYSVKSNRDWIYPNGNYSWKVRFSPNKEGNWQYRLTAQDSSGKTTSSTQAFTATSNPNNHGFIKVSKTDSRYFEYEDGTYFPGLGYNMNFSHIDWNNPVLNNQINFQKMGQNGVQLIRMWLTQWSIFGSQDNIWRSANRDSNYDALIINRAGAVYPGSDASMEVKWSSDLSVWAGNPCMFLGWMKTTPAVKPNASYHVSLRYRMPETLNGPKIVGQPYGLVVKLGGWLTGSFTLPSDWPPNYHCAYPATLATPLGAGYGGGDKAISSYVSTATPSWSTLEADFTVDSNSNFLKDLYIAVENINPTVGITNGAYIDNVEVKENIGNGQFGPNIISQPSMSHLQYFDQDYSYRFDKVLDLAHQNNVYLKVVGLEKGETTQNSFDYNGNPVNYNSGTSGSSYFYGNWGAKTKIYWLQQAYWRYLQARWGYSTNIHSWELLNEGDPFSGLHSTLANNFAKYMHQFTPDNHLVTTSNWNSFPLPYFWQNPSYQDLDYADVHQYITASNINVRTDKPTVGASVNVGVPADFYDSAAETYKISMQLGAKQPYGVNKPVMRGETGFVVGNSDGANHGYFNNDTQGTWLHKYIWGGINSGGLIESYWYETTHIYNTWKDKIQYKVCGSVADAYGFYSCSFDFRDQFGKYYNFIKDIPLSNGNYKDASASASNTNLRAWGQKDIVNGKAHIWIDNKTHNWQNVVKEATGSSGLVTLQSGTVTIPGMSQSNYTVSWFDTYAGSVVKTENLIVGSDGIATLNISNLASDVAVKLDKIVTTPCNLSSASWSTTTTTQGSTVNLNVTGNAQCAGKQINFEVRRNGTLLDDIPANIQPQTASMNSSFQATTTWITESKPLIPGTNPQYYFKATVAGGNTIDTKTQLLTVAGAPTPTPTVIPTPTLVPGAVLPNDWSMAGANPQRTSWVTSTAQNQTEIPWALTPEWYIPVEPFIHPKFQIIVAYDTIYTSTAKGLYAFNAATGSKKWVYPTDLPLGNSPTIYNGVAYVGGLDHKIHAVDAYTGKGLWTYEAGAGFETNPLVINNTLFAGNRDSFMYALDVTDSTNATKSRLKWKYQTAGPILYSAAAKPDNSTIYFASNDSNGYALNAGNGSLVWKQKLPGGSFSAWWPVYYSHPTQGDYVIFSGSFNHRPGLRPGLVEDWGNYNVFGKEWNDLFPTRLTRSTVLEVAPRTVTPVPGDWVSGTITMDASKSNRVGNDYTTALSEYYEEPSVGEIATDSAGLVRHDHKPWRRNYLVLNAGSGQEVTYDFDNDGQKEYAPISTAGVTHYSNRFPALVGLNNVLYQQIDGRSTSIPGSIFTGWKINTPYFSNTSSLGAVDEPYAFSAAGKIVYVNHCCDRNAGSFDITDLTGQSRWGFFSENNVATVLENLAPGYNTGYVPTSNDDYKDCCGYNYWTAFGGLDGAYGKHDLQNPPIPYKGRIYLQRGNSIIAFKYGATNVVKLPTATIVSIQNQPPVVTKQVLQTKLEDEIRKMIAAGHLKPGFFGVGLEDALSNVFSESLLDYFHNPFDTFYTLLRVRPLITDIALRAQLDGYIQSEWTNFNPTTINHIGWQEGVWRDSNLEVLPEVTADLPNFPKTSGRILGNNFKKVWDFNPMAWYAMWMYAQTYGGAEIIFKNGIASVPLMDSFVRVMDPTNITPAKLAEFSWAHNGYIAGYIGFANLYDLAVSQGMAPITGNLSTRYPYTVAQLKTEKDSLLLQRAQNFTKKTPYSNTSTGFQPRSLNPSRNFIFMVPELANYLRTSTAICADGKISLDCVKDTVAQFDKITPYWFVSKADLGYEESAFAPLYDYNSNFQAKAQILQLPFEELAKYIDVPAFDKGDLFYIQNLTSAILASGGGTTPTPTPTPSPVPCTLASAVWNTTTTTQGSTVNLNVVGNTNCAGKQVSFEVRRNGVTIDDIPANIQPQTASISASLQASTTWTAERNPLIPFTDAQYYFKATPQGGATISTKPQLLTVTQAVIVPTAPNDWPQVQKDPQRTGYSSETLGTNFKVKFTYAFQPDRIYPQVQAIVYQGKVFVGTEGANGQKPTVYAIDAVNTDPPSVGNGWQTTARVIWKFEAGGPILNSVAAYNNKIFFGAMDGAVYAVNSSDGKQVWKQQLSTRLGFSTAPVVADNKVMIGGRDGNFYALDQNDGHILWKYNTAAPILQTAASNNGKVYFGNMDMYFYAINTTDGTLAWKSSQRLAGLAFKDYWPVVTQGKVLVRSMSDMGAVNFSVLDENTGSVSTSIPQYDRPTMDGAATPPCVLGNGKLMVPANNTNSTCNWQAGWGLLDLATNVVTHLANTCNIGSGNVDENMNATCSSNLLFAMHTQEGNANYTGAYDLTTGIWKSIIGGAKNGQMTSNTQGGGGNPASISNGMIYHISSHELIGRTTQ